ncbi:MAG: type II toxin-antitoxin system HicB family antitoxin [Cryobacterium sp.]|nr:type II toxin-antitoxin system HicB family antitoxin [Cryobacterium sp.]
MVTDHYTYRVTWSPEDTQYVGLVAEFPSLSWLADSQVDALVGIRRVVDDVVRDLQATGESVPTPLADRHYSGEFKLRIPPELHRMLVIRAAEESVSLNRLISSQLVIR